VEDAFLASVLRWFSSRFKADPVCRKLGKGIWNGKNERRLAYESLRPRRSVRTSFSSLIFWPTSARESARALSFSQ
jgi:hypothetical protein